MPLLDDETTTFEPGGGSKLPSLEMTSPQAWRKLIKTALSRRLRPSQLESLAKDLQKIHKSNSLGLSRLLLQFRKPTRVTTDDPLLFRYIELMLNLGHVESGDLLRALSETSNFVKGTAVQNGPGSQLGFPSFEERVFTMLTRRHLTELPSPMWKALGLFNAVIQWLRAVSKNESGKQLDNAGLHTVDTVSMGAYEALGSLAIAVLRNPKLRSISKQRWWKDHRSTVVTDMENYDVNVLQWMQSQLAGALSALTGQLPYIATDEKGRLLFTDRQILSMVSEVPIAHSRAGLFIWLDSALAARPLTDDLTMISYLQARFPGDTQNLIVSTLVASFDVLTNAMLRKESRQTVKIIRSFICNKLPILLAMLSGLIAPPMTMEACIQTPFMAGGMISMDPLPPITAGATDINEILKTARLEFLQACALHGLVTEGGIATVLNGPIALPRITKYNRDVLSPCINNVPKLEALIDDLDAMQGNTAAIVACLVASVKSLCSMKDTMSLKTVCNQLVKKPEFLDILMQYTQPTGLLMPLCTILNEWAHDADQTEFTPSYEEFAGILLFTLATIHRFDVDAAELGLMSDSFMGKLLNELCASKVPADLSDEQSAQLGTWIEGLFSLDEHGETSGIGDDVMRNCSPQSFYLLVPTLFEQSVLACRTNVLSMKAFQGGLELLLEPFLLPSLIMGLGWLARHSWEDHNDSTILLQVLDKLLKPSTTSQEIQNMHRAVIHIAAAPLHDSIQVFLKKKPNDKKANELNNLLQKFLARAQPLQRNLHCSKAQIDAWVGQEEQLKTYVSNSIRSLINWTTSSSENANPAPKFSYKQFVLAAQVLDSDTLLDAVLKELRQVPIAQLPLALDVCAAIACAPPSISIGGQQASRAAAVTAKLHSSIQIRYANVQRLLDRPQDEAEALVRLGRRIEAEMAVTQLPAIPVQMDMADQATDQIMQDLGLDIPGDVPGAASDAILDQAGVGDIAALNQELGLDDHSAQELNDLASAQAGTMNIDDANLFGDISLGMDTSQGDGLTNPEEDIFADLMDVGGLDDFGDDYNFDS